jgi:hypothetical protein
VNDPSARTERRPPMMIPTIATTGVVGNAPGCGLAPAGVDA